MIISRNLCHSGKFSTAPPLPPKKNVARTPMRDQLRKLSHMKCHATDLVSVVRSRHTAQIACPTRASQLKLLVKLDFLANVLQFITHQNIEIHVTKFLVTGHFIRILQCVLICKCLVKIEVYIILDNIHNYINVYNHL